ncbi:MAG: hypothetical protein ACT4P4_15860 [Betaproteobacteria bacterium]
MPKTLAAVLLALAALPAAAADERASNPPAEPRVIHIDANTQIRVDPKLREVTGTDTAGAGASMEERHRREMKAGAAGPDEDAAKATLPDKPEKTKKPRRN